MRILKAVFVFTLLIAFFPLLRAQKLMQVITVSLPKHEANEPSIAINPTNKLNIIVATNTNHIYWSKNGGKKFKHYIAKSSLGVYGDPVLIFDEKGTAYYAHLAKAKNKTWPAFFDQMVVQKSTNKGKSFDDGIGIGKNGKMQDKAWLSIHNNQLQVSWTEFDKYGSAAQTDSSRILFSAIQNNVASQPVQVNDINGNCIDSDSTMEGATTCVGNQGEIYMAWAGNEKIYFDQSFDNGKTWGTDHIIAQTPKGWDLTLPDFYRTNGMPFLAIDKNQTLFCCAAFEENNFNRVFVFESNNKGQSWQKTNFPLLDSNTHYMMPHAYMDETTGNYYVLYYGVKNGWIDVYLSYKLQHATEFKTIRINEKPSQVPRKEIFFGDYINVCAVGKTIAMVWTEATKYTTVVKFRKMELE